MCGMKPIIELKNVSKKYQLSHQPGTYLSLRDDLSSFFRRGFRKSEEFWALKDVSFEVQPGEVLGIIGKNGAGKSTLLKILSRITPPTTGEIKLRGLVGSLLEVGTGFHPELSGRENIFLNGAILGMTRKEIQKKFDEIVEFSGVEKFLDTPVKFYSSGMYVRLAFAVAAHLETDILLVDEVLAVGDAEFQKKCLGKMEEVTRKQGRTILFVSHNMGAIKETCQKAILLGEGIVISIGDPSTVISKYLEGALGQGKHESFIVSNDNLPFRIIYLGMMDKKGQLKSRFSLFEDVYIKIKYLVGEDLVGSVINFTLKKGGLKLLISFDTDLDQDRLGVRIKGEYETTVVIPGSLLKPGAYSLDFRTGFVRKETVQSIFDALAFEISSDVNLAYHSYDPGREGLVAMPLKWNTQKI